VSVDGHIYDLNEEIKLEKNNKHNISVIIDRLVVKEGIEKRLSDSLESSLKLGGGLTVCEIMGTSPRNADAVGDKEKTKSSSSKSELPSEITLSQNFSCPDCGISVEEFEPRTF
jgi:excinuclease ABC subunit A